MKRAVHTIFIITLGINVLTHSAAKDSGALAAIARAATHAPARTDIQLAACAGALATDEFQPGSPAVDAKENAALQTAIDKALADLNNLPPELHFTPTPLPTWQLSAAAGVAGAAAAGLTYWACNPKHIGEIVKNSLTQPSNTRFPALLAAPWLANAAQSAITPVVGLAIVGGIYYKLKQGILEPVELRHAQQLAAFNEKLLHHKKETLDAMAKFTQAQIQQFEQFTAATRQDVTQLRHNVVDGNRQADEKFKAIQQELDAALSKLKDLGVNNKEIQATVAAALQKTGAVEISVAHLATGTEKHVEQLKKIQAAFMSQGEVLQKQINALKTGLDGKKDKKKGGIFG